MSLFLLVRAKVSFFLWRWISDFFLFWPFFNYYFRNELGEMFFLNLDLLSHANPSGATYKGVAPVHLARLKGLACVR
jgi:hypothetical protein